MWGYLVTAGTGLLGILGCTIWALVERSRRRSAELAQATETARALKAEGIATTNAAVVASVKAELGRTRAESEVLSAQLAEFRKRLEACADPQAVKDWLDELGRGGSV